MSSFRKKDVTVSIQINLLVVRFLLSVLIVQCKLGKYFRFFNILFQVQVFGLYSAEEFHETFDCPIKVSACFNL